MTPDSDLNDLAQKLNQKKADADYRRLRAIQQFSHRMRAAAIIMTFFFLTLGFIFYMLNVKSQQPVFAWLMIVAVIAGWAYLLALPIFFVLRTTLLAYVLEKHWVWLSLVVGLPIDIYFLPSPEQSGPAGVFGRIPIVFFALLLWGFIRRKARRQVFQKETKKHDELWTRLLPLGVLDIALFGFWRIRPQKSVQSDAPPS